MWKASYRNLGLAIVQLHLYPFWGLRAHRTCGPTEYMPSSVFRFMSMLLSTFDFRRRVSSCPRGSLLSSSPVLHGNFICTEAAHPPIPFVDTAFESCKLFLVSHRIMLLV